MNTSNDRRTFFVDVIVPVPVAGVFTYRVPHELNAEGLLGKRVVVQFGRKKIYAGLVRQIHENIPVGYTPKYILGVLDDEAVVTTSQLNFWDWICNYYLCYPGEVMQTALPSALRLASETSIVLADGFKPDAQLLSEYEYLITEALMIQQKLSLSEVSKIVGFQKVMPLIHNMISRKMIVLEEELEEKYKPRKASYVRLAHEFRNEESLKSLMNELSKRAYKQLEILLSFISLSRYPVNQHAEIGKNELLEKSGASYAQLKSLVDKKVFEIELKIVSRLNENEADSHAANIKLSPSQTIAFENIKTQFDNKNVVLLNGVTASGKTEIYIKLIHDAISRGEQVLYLLPEIALTTQIINRLKKYFGNSVGVFHSRYNSHEKVEIWKKVLAFDGSVYAHHQVVLGPRSALFLPFKKLGLVIVDEEHDQSFKQMEPSPRYHARDAAIMLASTLGAKVLLGSATPSIESFYNAQQQRYGLVNLTERYSGMELPEVSLVNLREEMKRKTMKSHFSQPLLLAISEALGNKEQVILFQNRRGFSLRLECDQCHYVPQCKNCDVSLIYHKKQQLLRCHYCGFATAVPVECPECRSTALRMHGFGTEKVEEELSIILPNARIGRLDLDTTRSKFAFQTILEDFESGKIDILTGTQMVTKGLDFGKVRVVGILNADSMLSYPDFRAYERGFQLMAQVSGRAGRKSQRGKVFIQTHQSGHPLLHDVVTHNFGNMYTHQLNIRHHYHYPPFFRLILLRLRHRDEHLLNLCAAEMAQLLKSTFRGEVLGPEFPMVSRIKNLFIKQIILKIPRNESSSAAKDQLKQIIRQSSTSPHCKSILLSVDVDPY